MDNQEENKMNTNELMNMDELAEIVVAFTTEHDRFTIAELTGLSFWEAFWPILVFMFFALLLYFADIIIVGIRTLYDGSVLQYRIGEIRWKIAAWISPEMEKYVHRYFEEEEKYHDESYNYN